jgi:hypothetical protein
MSLFGSDWESDYGDYKSEADKVEKLTKMLYLVLATLDTNDVLTEYTTPEIFEWYQKQSKK